MTEFKKGDKVRHKGSTGELYEVLGISGDGIHLWLSPEGRMPYTGIAKVYEKVEPFFEMDKKYYRPLAWSIHFQRYTATEFTPEAIRKDSSGILRAFGRLDDVNSAKEWRWITLTPYDFRAWEEDDE